jgi:hypothetical protein
MNGFSKRLKKMNTQLITVEIDLIGEPLSLHKTILEELEKWGEPLRWAITEVKIPEQKVRVEAIVTDYKGTGGGAFPTR